MLFNPAHKGHLERLNERLRLASAVSFDLFADILATCTRIALLAKAGKTGRLNGLIRANAWTDVALTLIALETPNWKLRRLEYEDGAWICSLSTQPNMPMALDETADARHEVLPLAILSALLEARSMSSEASHAVSRTPRRFQPAPEPAIPCDNFA